MNEQGFCEGCYRTIKEISSWWDMPDTQKREVIQLSRARESAAFDAK
jgi:predicted Fe-S protein YdhL (DUF1289 family)